MVVLVLRRVMVGGEVFESVGKVRKVCLFFIMRMWGGVCGKSVVVWVRGILILLSVGVWLR